MKAIPMATEPVSSGLLAGLVMKLGPLAAVGAVGGFIMSLFDQPASRKARVIQATVAGTAAIVFGKAAAAVAAGYVTSVPKDELLLPVGFLVGSVSWGAFAALHKFRQTVADKAADKVAEKVGL